MSSKKEIVVLRGSLKGNGYEATCTVQALKVSLPPTDHFTYAQFNITSVSEKLPPGVYELTVAGETSSVRQSPLGPWIAA